MVLESNLHFSLCKNAVELGEFKMKNRFKNTILFNLVLISLILSGISCFTGTQPSSRINNRSLTEDEMSLPGWYEESLLRCKNPAGLMSRPGILRTSLSAPQAKPKVKWSKQINSSELLNPLVDNEGYTWYYPYRLSDPENGRSLEDEQKVTRLKPDGSTSREKMPGIDRQFKPVAVCKNAIILFDYLASGSKSSDYSVCLECIDFNFNTIWRSENIKYPLSFPSAWRIGKDRIMMSDSSSGNGQFNIYSIADGELVKTIVLPDFPEPTVSGFSFPYRKVIESNEGGWIGMTDSAVVRYSDDLKLMWKYDIPSLMVEPESAVSNLGIVTISDANTIIALYVPYGTVAWEKSEGKNYQLAGVTPDGSFLFYLSRKGQTSKQNADASKTNNGCLALIDTNGVEKWAIPIDDNPQQAATVIYDDGSVLFNHLTGIIMAKKDGSILWQMDKNDFASGDSFGLFNWFISPAPNDRIVVGFNNTTEKGRRICSLE